jgi:putative FmdB family regulatory protein
MPTYEYRCKDCGHELEAVQSFTDDPLTECPSCGGTLKKKFGVPGISFKGSGFYKTDSRNGKSSAAATGASAGESGSSSADSSAGGDSGKGAGDKGSSDTGASSSPSSSSTSAATTSSGSAKQPAASTTP